MALVCHIVLQDNVIKGLCDFMGWRPSWNVTTLPRLVVKDIVVVQINECL